MISCSDVSSVAQKGISEHSNPLQLSLEVCSETSVSQSNNASSSSSKKESEGYRMAQEHMECLSSNSTKGSETVASLPQLQPTPQPRSSVLAPKNNAEELPKPPVPALRGVVSPPLSPPTSPPFPSPPPPPRLGLPPAPPFSAGPLTPAQKGAETAWVGGNTTTTHMGFSLQSALARQAAAASSRFGAMEATVFGEEEVFGDESDDAEEER